MKSKKRKLKELMGTYILIGITHLDYEGNIIRQDQYHGTFEFMDDHGVHIRLKNSGELFTLPPELLAFKKAEPGHYRLRSTGEVVIDPDFIAVWTVHPSSPNLEAL
ncbi:MAG: hypothetical protein ACFFBD_21000 [Candidatus Hodarchaeota archaeon]